ncbi:MULTISPECIES: DUF4381 family protein [unclassified Pantoea]|uniref:DUF4381 family protein n=1 Tax=unclassified Pantoea TaxID=2630326 RepID=UPI0024AF8FCF|nr:MULTISPECIES: DUF4381 family protein [unclassified Pantoea]MDI6957543.1 DUF4381 family protein [Pantoea sp. Pa-EAmG]MDI9221580.1 DUF4381 family protein [Pantoea sp. EA-12]
MLEKGFSVPRLQNPALPTELSWLPLPEGWYWLAAILLMTASLWLLLRIARWRRNDWRRQATRQLAMLAGADQCLNWIKQVKLIHQPRITVSSQHYVIQLLHDLPLSSELVEKLNQRYCQRDDTLAPGELISLKQQLKRWLQGLPDV